MHSIYWHRFPFLFLAIPLILGITVSQYLANFLSASILGVIITSFSLLFIIRKVRSGLPFVLLSFTGLFFTGVYLSGTKTPAIIPGETYQLAGRCEQILSPGKIVVSSPHLYTYLQVPDSTEIAVGDSLSGLIRLYPLQTSHHRHDFNYDNYLLHQGIQAKGFPAGEIHKTGHSQDLYSVCHTIRNNLAAKLQRVIPDSATYKLLAALCLGCRQEITPDTKELFQNTGTIHILAISGLHIGAIFAFFLGLFRLFHFKSKKFRLILIPLIWFTVCITGLSPSACRAATILSFITIGEVFRQETIPLNAIAAAVILADKSDVRRSRVRNKENTTFDIHDRVNYAVEKSSLILNRSARTISLILSIDTSICAVMDYFEIFLTRMMLSKRAAEYLDLSFKLEINGTQFL